MDWSVVPYPHEPIIRFGLSDLIGGVVFFWLGFAVIGGIIVFAARPPRRSRKESEQLKKALHRINE
jgi:preprotein translocase subunit YajC